MSLALLVALVFLLPLALLAGAVGSGSVLLWGAFVAMELVFARQQLSLARGSVALFYNHSGIRRLSHGDAAGAAKAFARALRFGKSDIAYVNNLALSLVYCGDLDRAREVLQPVIDRSDIPQAKREPLMSTWALLLALLGDLEGARAAEAAAGNEEFSVAAWVIAARERRWPFSRPAELKGAWARHLYEVLEAFVAGDGYRDRALARPLPIGLARALAFRWPEMKGFLGS